jgi:hypothetical protein
MLRCLLVLLLTFVLAPKAFAQNAACPALAPPQIELAFTEDPLSLHEDVDSAKLSMGKIDADVKQALDAVVSEEHVTWSTLGLSAGQLKAKYEVGFSEMHTGNNVCFTVSKIHYDIIYSPVIFIASDLANKSCTYPVIMTHEKSHVAVDEKTISDYLATMKQQISIFVNTIGQRGPYPDAVSLGAEKGRIAKIVEASTIPVWNQLTWLRRQRQLQIDTVANYRAEQAKCDGDWLVKK